MLALFTILLIAMIKCRVHERLHHTLILIFFEHFALHHVAIVQLVLGLGGLFQHLT